MKIRFIVDTHVWLWWNAQTEKLGRSAMDLLADSENEIVLSVVSVWEISIKYSLGKLPLPQPPRQYVLTRVVKDGFTLLDIQAKHALECAALPWHHRDPFDRMLAAQSKTERIPLLTADPVFGKYGVKVLKAAA